MMEYRKMDISEKEKLVRLEEKIYNQLERKEFFIPFSEEVKDMMFDEKEIIPYGAYCDGELVGTAQLYMSETCVAEIKGLLELKEARVVELGGALVLEEYRSNGVMKNLVALLVNEAKRLEFEYLVITVHPENIPSNKSMASSGAEIVMTTNLGEWYRNIYLLDLR